jgi:hypothetical protein
MDQLNWCARTIFTPFNELHQALAASDHFVGRMHECHPGGEAPHYERMFMNTSGAEHHPFLKRCLATGVAFIHASNKVRHTSKR